MELVRLRPEHVMAVEDKTPSLSGVAASVARHPLLCAKGFAVVEGPQVYACFGAVEYWPGREEAWFIATPEARRRFVAVHKLCKRALDAHEVTRLEAYTSVSSASLGQRWVRLLGFEMEAPRLKQFKGGIDAALFARVR